jgi:hypothetical protein
MKTRKYYLRFLPVITFLICTACSPRIKVGDIMQTGGNEADKYWVFDNLTTSGDTIELENKGAELISKFNIKNFVLSAQIMTVSGAEGSLAMHTGSQPVENKKGYTVLINSSAYRTGNLQKTGSLSYIRNNFVRTTEDNTWFSLEVSVMANHIRVSVNDKIISEYIQPENPVRIEELKNMVISDGKIVFTKTNDKGKILIGNIQIEAFDPNLALEADTAFVHDSTGEMLNLLNQQLFPVIDYHGHLKGGLTVDQMIYHGRVNGYNYGIAPNCGLNFPVTNDSALVAYYDEMKAEPVFKAMQCEGREWVTLFSPKPVSNFDYIFTDGMTWTDYKGRRMRLWMPEETFVDNEQQFMDMLTGKIVAILTQEPVDIYVNPTFLPPVIAGDYNRLWTPERMDKIIKALVDNDVALEINSRFKIPSLEFIKRAKAAGVKFSMGTNNAGNNDLGRLEYSLMIIREVGIQADDMFIPRAAGDKKVSKKGLPVKVTG